MIRPIFLLMILELYCPIGVNFSLQPIKGELDLIDNLISLTGLSLYQMQLIIITYSMRILVFFCYVFWLLEQTLLVIQEHPTLTSWNLSYIF